MPRYLSVLLLAVLDRWACSRGGGGATTVEAFVLVSPTTPTSTRRRFAEHVGTTASKPPVDRRLDRGTATATALGAKKKGFAKQAKAPPGARKPDALDEPVATAADASAAAPTRTTAAPEPREVELENEGSPASAEALNPGQRALAKLRREREEQRDRELRQVRDMLAADAQVQGAPAAIPERVAQRMGRRMLPFVGVPLAGSAATFVGFWYLRSYRNLEVQPSLVASASVFFLVVGLLGITYSVMSASWDEDREGDLMGADEFKKNVDNVRDGLSRSRENALLRERMAGAGGDDLERSLAELDEKDGAEAAKRRRQSLQAKLEDDLE